MVTLYFMKDMCCLILSLLIYRSMSMSPSRARPAAPDVGPVRQLIRESFQSSEPQGGRNGGMGFGRGRTGQPAAQPMGMTRLR